jgi:hypothetical protein
MKVVNAFNQICGPKKNVLPMYWSKLSSWLLSSPGKAGKAGKSAPFLSFLMKKNL